MTKTTTELPGNVEDVLEQLGIQVSTVGSKEISAHCPFHTDSHPSFSINAVSGLWICYQCSARGTLSMLVQKVSGTDADPVRLLQEVRRQSIGTKRSEPEPEPEPVVEEVVDPRLLLAQYESFKRPPRWALEAKQIVRAEADQYGLKWDKGWIIPIWSPKKKRVLRGWQFKRLDYVSNYPNAVKKSQTLFGLHELSGRSAVLVESPLDVVRLASVDVPAVAAYGAFVSRAQIDRLVGRVDHIVLALDNDEEGQRQMSKIYLNLARHCRTEMVTFPAGAKDPGDLDDEQALGLFGALI